jgi:protease I
VLYQDCKKLLVLIVIWSLISLACGQNRAEPKTSQSSEGNRTILRSVLMIIAPKDFRDEEFKVPYDYLKSLGHKVTIASMDTVNATGILGLVVKPDLKIDNIDSPIYDALVLVGGTGSIIYWDNLTVQRLVKYFARPPKILAAICLAPVTLARAGVLKDKFATIFKDLTTIDELQKGGAEYVEKDIVISDNIITASGPQASEKFAKAIAKVLASNQ